jgi:uncharacterized repeat protein (TIGR01451 family)
MLYIAHPLHRRPAILAIVAVMLASCPQPAKAQAIVTNPNGSNQAVTFATPGIGLPTPLQVSVPGLPTGAYPHGVGYYGPDNALVSDGTISFPGGNYRVFVIQVSTAMLVDTIPTYPSYDGFGSIAVAPSLTAALAADDSGNLTVIAAPFNSSSTITTIPLTGYVATYQTEAIVFDAAGRAFVNQSAGISVIDPPYTGVAFTIPTSLTGFVGAIAITPDGHHLLFTDLTNPSVQIITAPYSAASVPVSLAIPGGSQLDGICATPDGAKVLVVSGDTSGLFAISAPYSAASVVESIPLPGGPYGGFEDVGISADGGLAVLAGNGHLNPHIPFVVAPFTAASATVFDVIIAGGRGDGAVRIGSSGLAPDLTIGKGAPSSVPSGADLTYALIYGNAGAVNASGVIIHDALPIGTTFVSATGGGTLSAGIVSWNIGNLNAGVVNQTVFFTVNFTATSGTIDNNEYSIEGTGIAAISGPPVTTVVLGPAGVPGCCGDGSSAACPCLNFGAPCNGCANSGNAAGASLSAIGSPNSEYPTFVTFPDTVIFTANGLPSTAFAILFKGTSTTAPVMFGDGLRCCSGALRRLAAQNAVAGSFNFGYPTAKVSVAGHSPPGEHACYQLYYRDPNSSFCTTATFNITNSYQITWL